MTMSPDARPGDCRVLGAVCLIGIRSQFGASLLRHMPPFQHRGSRDRVAIGRISHCPLGRDQRIGVPASAVEQAALAFFR